MNTAGADELTEVLDRVKDWSVAERVALVKGVLDTFASDVTTPAPLPSGRSMEEIIKIFKTDEPKPDVDTVRQWIDEHRMEKYGS
jgi:hypothetical protein